MGKPKYIPFTTEQMSELLGKHLDLPPMQPLGAGWIMNAEQWRAWRATQPFEVTP